MIKRIKEIIKKREKKKRGFTLVELLAVIVILAVIMVITIPTVLGNLENSKQKAFSTVGKTMQKYLEDNYKNCKLGNELIAKYDKELFNGDCSLNTENMQKLIKNSGYSTNDIARVDVTDDGRGNYGVYMYPGSTGKFSGVRNQLTNPIPNKPDLSTGLVPVKYNGSNWVITTPEDPDWFNYSNQKWANAVSLAEGISKTPGTVLKVPDGTSTESDVLAMFVWIPRFSYTIGCTDLDGKNGINTNVTIDPGSETEVPTECLGYKVEGASDLNRLTPGAIDIKFVSTSSAKEDPGLLEENPIYPIYEYSNDKRNPDNWYTHPAFIFGDKELSGIWVGKFETSVNPNSECYKNIASLSSATETMEKCQASKTDVTPIILPNVLSLVLQNVYNQFETAKKFTSNTIYGLTPNTDSHMMKNSEWGAVAYLSQSIYGKYGNNNYIEQEKQVFKNNSSRNTNDETNSFFSGYTGRSLGEAAVNGEKNNDNIHWNYTINGFYKYDGQSTPDTPDSSVACELCGTGASTTGNIYGIYDMSGGANEYVMGYYYYDEENFGVNEVNSENKKYSGFGESIDNKYFNGYNNGNSIIFSKTSDVIGHATAETLAWYGDGRVDLTKNGPWLVRGGNAQLSFNNGLFYAYGNTGGYMYHYSFRTTLVNDN